MSPFDTKQSDSFAFSNMLPTAEKEDTFSNILPTSDKEDTFSNTLPTSDKEDTFSNTLPPDSTEPPINPALTPAEQRIDRRLLFSHITASIFAIPTLTLISLDLHAYQTRPPTTLPCQPGQYSTVNPLLILDILSVILLSATLLYAATFLRLRFQHQITPLFLQENATSLYLLDALLCVGVQALSDTIIGMRIGSEPAGCQRFTYLDTNACNSGRRTIMRAAGAMGILTG
jgi:hypothetical protein